MGFLERMTEVWCLGSSFVVNGVGDGRMYLPNMVQLRRCPLVTNAGARQQFFKVLLKRLSSKGLMYPYGWSTQAMVKQDRTGPMSWTKRQSRAAYAGPKTSINSSVHGGLPWFGMACDGEHEPSSFLSRKCWGKLLDWDQWFFLGHKKWSTSKINEWQPARLGVMERVLSCSGQKRHEEAGLLQAPVPVSASHQADNSAGQRLDPSVAWGLSSSQIWAVTSIICATAWLNIMQQLVFHHAKIATSCSRTTQTSTDPAISLNACSISLKTGDN